MLTSLNFCVFKVCVTLLLELFLLVHRSQHVVLNAHRHLGMRHDAIKSVFAAPSAQNCRVRMVLDL